MIATLAFPRSDDALLQWSQNVVNFITPLPANWGLVIGDVTTYTGLHSAYSTALTACGKSIRNQPAVVIKNAARTALKNGATTVANKIYGTSTVTDAMKVEIGMPPRATPTQVPQPSTSPTIKILATTGCSVVVRLLEGVGGRRGLAAGCSGDSVFSFIGETAPTDITKWVFQGNTGRVNKIEIPFPPTLAAGSKVWITSFYFNGRKQSGPATPPVSINVPGGGVSMAA